MDKMCFLINPTQSVSVPKNGPIWTRYPTRQTQTCFHLQFVCILASQLICIHLTGTQQIMGCFTFAQQIQSMIGERVQNSMHGLKSVWHQLTVTNSHGSSSLLIVCLDIHQTVGMQWRVRLKSQWDENICRSYGRNIRWILHFMDMSIIMKEPALYTRYSVFVLFLFPFLDREQLADNLVKGQAIVHIKGDILTHLCLNGSIWAMIYL